MTRDPPRPPRAPGPPDPPSSRRWRIGELAEATGLTVRTLHHYEQIGLLEAGERTEGNQRIYDASDVQRLYRIRALRALGISLSEVAEILDGGAGGLPTVLQAHLQRAEEELARLSRLRDGLRRLCERGEEELPVDDLLDTLEAMARLERHVERLPPTSGAAGEQERVWRDLGEALRACQDEGLDPGAARVRLVATRIRARIHDFARGDAAILDALAVIRRSSPPRALAGWDPPLFAYLERALGALDQPPLDELPHQDRENP